MRAKTPAQCLYLLTSVCLCVPALAGPAEYHGRFLLALAPERTFGMEPLHVASREDLARLEKPLPASARAFAGASAWEDGHPLRFLLIEQPRHPAVLYADSNLDGRFAESEKIALGADPAQIELPLASGPFRSFPVLVRLRAPDELGPSIKAERTLFVSFHAHAQGRVEIEGKQTLVEYEYYRDTGSIDPRNGTVCLDLNGDGKVERDGYECDYAHNEDIVFRLGKLYLSTAKADIGSGEIVLRGHPEEDYTRIELKIGTQVPDFAFTDFDGRWHNLSDFHARYLLLEFWGTWCPPCVAEIPYLHEAYDGFHARGFDVLGMPNDQDSAKLEKFLKDQKVNWTQARPADIRSLTEDRFRIQTVPYMILLDEHKRIVSLDGEGQLPLSGPELLKTLEWLFGGSR